MKKGLYIAIVLLVAMVATGCSDDKHLSVADLEEFSEADGFNRADSIVEEVSEMRDNDLLLATIDSLEKTGELSLAKTIFYRTITYNLMGQQSTSLRLYYQLDSLDVKTLTTQADLESYVYSYNNYVRVLCDMRRYDRALREAHKADRKLRTIGYDSFTDHHDIAQIIGECQLYMDQADEAAKSYQKSLRGVHSRLAKFSNPLDLRECQKTMNAIARAYIHMSRYDEATPWIHIEDSLYDLAVSHPKRDTIFIDEMKADICYSKALLALALGRKSEAERAFRDYQSTNTAKQLGNIMNSNDYLMQTKRYGEAARNFEQLDRYLLGSGYKYDLENINRFVLPKYRANLLAGRRDSALYVATQVAENYNDALVNQKMIDADLLTTIYDTEGKERQIAEQRAKLSQQRLITLGIVTLIIIVFFYIYYIQRRKAFKKLDATNQQLILANERAEESSRLKTQFIQKISHEVRTPLNLLSGFSQVLVDRNIEITDEERQDICQKISQNSDRITHLMDRMLDLSLVNSKTRIECHDRVKVVKVAEQAVNNTAIDKALHLDFTLNVDESAEDVTMITDMKSSVKALSLLLDNAQKFTQPQAFRAKNSFDGKATVELDVSVEGQRVAFVVSDTGVGVPPEEAETIFEDFVQLDEFSHGAGIGLTIARSLARHMGGDVVIDKAYTSGARFVMTLPL